MQDILNPKNLTLKYSGTGQDSRGRYRTNTWDHLIIDDQWQRAAAASLQTLPTAMLPQLMMVRPDLKCFLIVRKI